MKKLIIYILCVVGIIQLSSCGEQFLDVSPKGIQLESNYYQTPDQAFAALTAAYNPVLWQGGGSDATYIPLLAINTAADECFAGGGGSGDLPGWQAWKDYTMTDVVGPQAGYWDRNYTGIYRANLLLEKIDGVKGLSEATKKRYIGECRFLRAYYYFWLVRLFKNVVLTTKPITTDEIYKQVQAPPDSVYAQIEKDLRLAIPDLPAAPLPANENGRVTKGAARAFLAKAIMYEAGPDDNSRMLEAAGILEKVNTAPAYELLDNFPDIFSPDNKFNSESIFEIPHTQAQNAGWGNFPASIDANLYVQMVGPRSYSGPIYWSGGYSFNPLTKKFVDAIYGDPRYQYTVADIDSLTAATGGSYTAGYDNTGYFIKKFAPRAKYVSTTGQQELNFPNDYIEIRLADTYLMEAEALIRGGGSTTKAAHYLNAVRQRVGLTDVTPTLKNIYHERRMELATEGHRWFDLVRTGRAADVLSYKGFKKGVNEILPIPHVELTNTKLKQNPGYD